MNMEAIINKQDEILRKRLNEVDGAISQAENQLYELQNHLNDLHGQRREIVGGLGTLQELKTSLTNKQDGK